MMTGESSGPIRVLVVDDEPLARDCVRLALEDVDEIDLIGECGDGEEAVAAIREAAPDLVLLDVQMPELDGFDVVERIGVEEMPAVVFVTAYDEHAVRAFEVHAIDYIMKPFDDARLVEAVRHALRQIRLREAGELGRRLAAVLTDLPAAARPEASGGARSASDGPNGAYASRVLVRDRDRFRFVETAAIDWLEAAGNYVRLHTGDRSHLIRATLSGTLERLDPARFVRIHRSTVVNVERIREVQPWVGGDYVAILHDGRQLKVSRTYRDSLLRPLS